MADKGLKGKLALVTGSTSGIGLGMAKALAQRGCNLVINGFGDQAEIDRLVKSLGDTHGVKAVFEAADLSKVADTEQLMKRCAQVHGGVDILVNNAGVTRSKPLLDEDEDDWDHVVGINARGAFLVATGAAREMVAAGRRGSIINIASILGLRQAKQVASYAISKAGLLQMTKVMALELARFGIRVNSLCPGYVSTELNQEFLEGAAGKALLQRIPQRRVGSLQDLDGPLLLLASDASLFMTGAELVIDGGHVMASL